MFFFVVNKNGCYWGVEDISLERYQVSMKKDVYFFGRHCHCRSY